jgi:hypothetical protein
MTKTKEKVMYPYLLPFNFNFGSSSLRLIGALFSNYKVEEGFQSIIAIGNRSTTGWQCSERIRSFASAQLAGNYASNNVPYD